MRHGKNGDEAIGIAKETSVMDVAPRASVK
jgi:hypothetical protein